jgi:hypothetical protein
MRFNLILYALATLTPLLAAAMPSNPQEQSLGSLFKRQCLTRSKYCDPSENTCCDGMYCESECGLNGCIASCGGAAGPP